MSIQSTAKPLLIYPTNLYNQLQAISFKGTTITDGYATLYNGTLSGLVAPTDPSDAANKAYVDSSTGGSPGGIVSSIQFNDNGVFGGSANLLWSTSTSYLNVLGGISATSIISSTLRSDILFTTNITTTLVDTTSILATSAVISNISATSVTVGPIVINNGAITGLTPLTIASDPSSAADKAYVDSKIGSNPGGPFGSIQFNDGGIFGGTSLLSWNTATSTLTLTGLLNVINTTTSPNIFTGVSIFVNTTNSTAYNNGALVVYGGLGVGMDVNINGNCSANEFFSTSDMNLKEDIRELTDSIDKLSKIKCYSFKFKNSHEESCGLIAQQLEEIGLGNVVRSRSGHKTVNYSHFIAILIDAFKELNGEITDLKRCINILSRSQINSYKGSSRGSSRGSQGSSPRSIPSSEPHDEVEQYQDYPNFDFQSDFSDLLDICSRTKSDKSSDSNSDARSIHSETDSDVSEISIKITPTPSQLPPIINKIVKQQVVEQVKTLVEHPLPTERKYLRNIEYKYCMSCYKWKIVTIFQYDSTSIDNLRIYCMECLDRI